jgi:NTE family protein
VRFHAVFEGGGVKGIALAGAVKAAEEKGASFDRVAGTSSGAIVASLIAAGYRGEELLDIIQNTPFPRFADAGTGWKRIIPPLRFLFKRGLFSAKPLEEWISGLLAAKGVCCFADLPEGKLRVVASDISSGRMLVLPDDLPKYGVEADSFPVAQAVRMSAGIPYFFEPATLGKARNVIVDGGLLSNFPLWLFDRENAADPHAGLPAKRLPVIGFQLVGKNDQEPRRISGPLSMLHALVSTMLEAHDERYIEQHNRFRTVKIPTLGVRTTQFDLPQEMVMKLYESGYEAGRRFFERWSLVGYQKSYDLYVGKAVPKTIA